MKTTNTKKKKPFDEVKMLGIICMVCCLSLVLMGFAVVNNAKSKSKNVKSFIPPEFDASAVEGVPEVPENLGYSPFKVEEGFTAYVCGDLTVVGGAVDVYFTSPDTNTVWLMLQLIDAKNSVLGKTGIIRPGEYVKALALTAMPDKETSVKLKIIAFRPESYVSMGTMSLNTKLKIGGTGD